MQNNIISNINNATNLLLKQNISKNKIFEYIGYINVNELATVSIVAQISISQNELYHIEQTLLNFEKDTKNLVPLDHNLKGNKLTQLALSMLFFENTFISDMPQQNITEEAIICLNYIKWHNPNLKRLSTQLDFNENEQSFEFKYQVDYWK